MSAPTLPFPPEVLKRSVGPVEDRHYDNAQGARVFEPFIPCSAYRSILDFGCGCGRVARQLIQMTQCKLDTYVGFDVHAAAIDWCTTNLAAADARFSFVHYDVWNNQFNPGGRRALLDFPAQGTYSLVNAHSVFTHIVEPELAFYVERCARALDEDGYLRATFFCFDKRGYPMMQEYQNALYINLDDPTNAVVYDYNFVTRAFRDAGMTIVRIAPPSVRGHQWVLLAAKAHTDLAEAEWPEDVAPLGIVRPPA